MWLDGVPHDPGADSQDRFVAVRAVTCHRTIGRWSGDYGVGKNRSHAAPGTFNFLVGQDEGQWVQFYRADCRCSHAAGANYAGPGIEFSGLNDERLTPWQIKAGAFIVGTLVRIYGFPRVLREDSPRIWLDQSGYRGAINHLGVDYPPNPSYRHYDFITQAEFLGGVEPPPELPDLETDMLLLAENADHPKDYYYVTPAGVLDCPPQEFLLAAKSDKAINLGKVGAWVLRKWDAQIRGDERAQIKG